MSEGNFSSAAITAAAEVVDATKDAATPPAPEVFEASLAGVRGYLENKLPSSLLVGGITGFTTGFYLGESAALYTAAYSLGASVGATSLFLGTYGLRRMRQKDDALNFVISGAFNGAWIVTGLAGRRRGIAGAVVGAAAGLALKVGGDALYDTSRTAWIRYRKYTLENSKPRVMDVRKPLFRPEDSTLGTQMRENLSAVPKRDSPQYIRNSAGGSGTGTIVRGQAADLKEKEALEKSSGWW